MMAFYRRAIKIYRDARCRNLDHFWTDTVVKNAHGGSTGIVVRTCTNCKATYTMWQGGSDDIQRDAAHD